MNIALWITQGLLAALFLMSGTMKTFTPKQKLAEKMPWANDFSAGAIKFIGITQLLGALGMVLPMLTHILPILTPMAGIGLALTMLVAAVYHVRKNEAKVIGKNLLFLAMAAFVTVGRFLFI